MSIKKTYFRFGDLGVLKGISNFAEFMNKADAISKLFNFKEVINIVKIYEFDIFQRILMIKIPSWVIGISYDNTIVFLDKSKWKNTDIETINELILHEMVHVIIGHYCTRELPLWLNEGLAVCLSGQVMICTKEEKQTLMGENVYDINYSNSMIYKYSGFIVKCLIEKYGLEKILYDIKYFDLDCLDEKWKQKNILSVVSEYF